MANCSQPFTDISEFLREKQRDGEVHHEKNRENQSGRRYPIHVHGLPQLLACLDVEKRQGEENDGEQQHHCVLHAGTPPTGQSQAGRTSGKTDSVRVSSVLPGQAQEFALRSCPGLTKRLNRDQFCLLTGLSIEKIS
jgi:hypothetical protein